MVSSKMEMDGYIWKDTRVAWSEVIFTQTFLLE